MAQTRLQPVEIPPGEITSVRIEGDNSPSVSRETPRGESALISLLLLATKSLSQRALVALGSLVDLALIASAFVLWLNVISEPSVLQLVGIGMYAVFILASVWTRHR